MFGRHKHKIKLPERDQFGVREIDSPTITDAYGNDFFFGYPSGVQKLEDACRSILPPEYRGVVVDHYRNKSLGSIVLTVDNEPIADKETLEEIGIADGEIVIIHGRVKKGYFESFGITYGVYTGKQVPLSKDFERGMHLGLLTLMPGISKDKGNKWLGHLIGLEEGNSELEGMLKSLGVDKLDEKYQIGRGHMLLADRILRENYPEVIERATGIFLGKENQLYIANKTNPAKTVTIPIF